MTPGWRDALHGAARALAAAAHRLRGPYDPDRLDARSPALIDGVLPLGRLVSAQYLKVHATGFDRLPAGPALYVANHNGGNLGPDIPATMTALWDARGPAAPLYALAHDFAMRQLTPVGRLIQGFGAIRARPENALRALRGGAQVLVYPGGDLDAYRHFRRRDEVVLGPRTGFVKVAQAAGVPIVPIVAQGAHRSAYIFTEGRRIASALRLKSWARLERFPLALALPYGVAIGPWLPYLPLPFPIRLKVLAPIEAPAGDPREIRDEVQRRMQAGLTGLAAQNENGARRRRFERSR